MKKIYQICLLNIGLALVIAVPAMYVFGGLGLRGYTGSLGLVSVFGGALNILIGLFLLAARRKVWGQGYLLSAGILLLLGFALCSTLY